MLISSLSHTLQPHHLQRVRVWDSLATLVVALLILWATIGRSDPLLPHLMLVLTCPISMIHVPFTMQVLVFIA